MTREDLVLQLVMEWESRNDRGDIVDLVALCQSHPELLDDVQEKVVALESINNRISTNEDLTSKEGHQSYETNTPISLEFLGTQSEFKIIKNYAQGGLGQVLLAEDTQLGRRVALKVIQPSHDHNSQRRKRFVREAELTSRLEHPGVVPVYGMGVDKVGRACYTMRFIDGETLKQEIAKFHESSRRPFSANPRGFRQLLNSFAAVCKTVAYAHSKLIIHRDIKPANIIVGRYGETLLVDWGLAKQLPSDSTEPLTWDDTEDSTDSASNGNSDTDYSGDTIESLTQNDIVMGTPGYISPEQARDSQTAGPASDVWSLGATLFAILTGGPPIQSKDLGSILQNARDGSIPLPCLVNPAVPRPLEAICLKAMAIQPDRRYESALALALDIEQWLAGEPVQAYPEPIHLRMSRWLFRHRTLVTSAAAALLVAAAMLAILLAFTTDANSRLRESNAKEASERKRATQNEALAEDQSELALGTLRSVIRELQVQLKNVPAAHAVRKSMLDNAVVGLKNVSANLKRQPEVNHNLVRAHLDLGDLFFEIGDESGTERSETARQHYATALTIATTLAKNLGDLDAKRELAAAHHRLGKVKERLSTLADAGNSYQYAFDLRAEIAAINSANDSDKRLLAVVCDDLGDVASDDGQLEEANKKYRRALDLRQDLVDHGSSEEQLVRDLQVSHDKLGTLALRTSQSEEAIEHFRQALEINKQRVLSTPDDSQTQRDLAYAHRQAGYGYWIAGRFADAEPEYVESLRLYNSYFELDPGNSSAERDLIFIHQRMGDLMLKMGATEKAQEHFQQMLRHCEKLVAVDPHNQVALRDLSVACGKRADILEAAGELVEAIELRNRNLEIVRQLAAFDPDHPRSRSLVASGLSQLAATLLEAKRPEDARPLLAEAVELSRSIWRDNPTDKKRWRQFLVWEMQLGVALKRTQHFDEARAAYADARKLTESLMATDLNNATIRLDMVTICYAQGILEFETEQFDAAKSAYQTALEVVIQLEEQKLLVGDDLTWRETLEEALKNVASAEK